MVTDGNRTAGRTRRLARSATGANSKLTLATALGLASTGGGTVIRFLLQVVLAQAMGTAGFGLYVTLRRWAELLCSLPNRGHHTTVVRFLPDYVAGAHWHSYRRLLRFSLGSTAIAAVATTAVAIIIGLLVWDGPTHLVVASLLAIFGWSAMRMLQAILQAQHQYVLSSMLDQLVQPLVMVAVLVVAWLAGSGLSVGLVLLALLISVVVSATLAGLGVRVGLPPAVRDLPPASLLGAGADTDIDDDHGPDLGPATDPGPAAEQGEVSLWRRTARRFYVGQLAITGLGTIDVLILALFVSNSEVGLYTIAARIALLARSVNQATESIVSPRIASNWAKRDMAGLQRTVDNAITISTVPTVILAVVLVLLRDPILRIVGEEYVRADTVMVILVLGVVIQALTGPCGFVVSLTNNERFHAATMVGAVIALAIGVALGAYFGGINAVAAALAVVTAGWNLVLVVFARTRLGIRCYPTRSLFHSLPKLTQFRR